MTPTPLEFHPDAAAELEHAFEWYFLKSERAASMFLDEIDNALSEISEHAERSPEHLHGTRRYLLRRFPYLVIYRVIKRQIQIVAVAHGRRRPSYWLSRVDDAL